MRSLCLQDRGHGKRGATRHLFGLVAIHAEERGLVLQSCGRILCLSRDPFFPQFLSENLEAKDEVGEDEDLVPLSLMVCVCRSGASAM